MKAKIRKDPRRAEGRLSIPLPKRRRAASFGLSRIPRFVPDLYGFFSQKSAREGVSTDRWEAAMRDLGVDEFRCDVAARCRFPCAAADRGPRPGRGVGTTPF